MGEINRTPISREDIQEYVKTNDDFRFEIKVRDACLAADPAAARRRGVGADGGTAERVDYAGTYVDPVTGKTRQFDIRAFWKSGLRIVQTAIECKCIQPYAPLVVSRIPRRSHESFHEVLYCYSSGKTFRSIRIEDSWHRQTQPVAKWTGQLRREISNDRKKEPKGELKVDDSTLFDKWTQASASANELIRTAPSFATINENDGTAFVMTIPALVIPDDTLWTVDYIESATGMEQQEPKQVTQVSLYIGQDYGSSNDPSNPRYCVSHLEFFTLTGFRDFLANLNREEQWRIFFPSEQIQNQLPFAPESWPG